MFSLKNVACLAIFVLLQVLLVQSLKDEQPRANTSTGNASTSINITTLNVSSSDSFVVYINNGTVFQDEESASNKTMLPWANDEENVIEIDLGPKYQVKNDDNIARKSKGLLTWFSRLFEGKGDPPPEKQYLIPDKKSVPLRAKVTLHPSEEWTNLMMSFHPSLTQRAPNDSLTIEQTKPIDVPKEHYPVDIEIPTIPWYPPYYYPQPPPPGYEYHTQQHIIGIPQQPNSGNFVKESSFSETKSNSQNQGNVQWNAFSHIQDQAGGYEQSWGGQPLNKGNVEPDNSIQNGNFHNHQNAAGHHSGANYGYSPPSHPHRIAQKRASGTDGRASGPLSQHDFQHFHVPIPVNANGQSSQKIRFHLPPGLDKDKVLIHVYPVNHATGAQGVFPQQRANPGPTGAEKRIDLPGEHRSEETPIIRSQNKKGPFIQDEEYLERLLAPTFRNQAPQQHILVPRGPVGEQMEARILAQRQIIQSPPQVPSNFQNIQGTLPTQQSNLGLNFGVPNLEGGFEPTQNFDHIFPHSFQQNQHQQSDHNQNDNNKPSLHQNLVPPSSGNFQNPAANIPKPVEIITGLHVTSDKETLASNVAANLAVDDTLGSFQANQHLDFASYPTRPNEDWGEGISGWKYPPHDNQFGEHGKLNNSGTQQQQVLIHSQHSSVATNHGSDRVQVSRPKANGI